MQTSRPLRLVPSYKQLLFVEFHLVFSWTPHQQFDPVRLFHCVVGLYCQALPDMELESVYGCVTASARTLLVLDTKGKCSVVYLDC